MLLPPFYLLLVLCTCGSRCVLGDGQSLVHTYPLYHRLPTNVVDGEHSHISKHEGKSYSPKTVRQALGNKFKTEKNHSKNLFTLLGSGYGRSAITAQSLVNDSNEAVASIRTVEKIPKDTPEKLPCSQTMASARSSSLVASHSLRKSTITDTEERAVRDNRINWTKRPGELTRVPLPGPQLCAASGQEPTLRGTAPPTVCDLCPTTVDNKNPLSPCTCVGNSGTGAGLISITCPPSTATTDQIHDILTNTQFLTTHVFRFSLRGSNVTGVLSQDLWGDLDFVQVMIVENQIKHVDNKAFINSADTLTFLNLDTNQITEYVTTNVDELPNLEVLVLKRNRLSFVYSQAFNYSSLRVLDLSRNMIDGIGKEAFAALDKLEELYLDHNLLTSIDDDTFTFLHHNPASNFLQISLSWNKISHISDGAFRGLRNVQINLQENKLTTVSAQVFRPIILDSQYFAFFALDGNDIQCDCKLMWIVEDQFFPSCFDNFICANNGIPLYALTPSDLGNCTDSTSL